MGKKLKILIMKFFGQSPNIFWIRSMNRLELLQKFDRVCQKFTGYDPDVASKTYYMYIPIIGMFLKI